MRKLCAFALFLFASTALALPLHGRSEDQTDSTDQEFSSIAARWLVAYNGTDPSALTPFYAPHAQYISGHVKGLVADGRDAVIANFAKGMRLGGHLDAMTILDVHRSCDQAVVLCQYEANNSGQRVSGRTLLVLEKHKSTWLIVLHMTVV
jgi:ketosteroid isomerase-like protein